MAELFIEYLFEFEPEDESFSILLLASESDAIEGAETCGREKV